MFNKPLVAIFALLLIANLACQASPTLFQPVSATDTPVPIVESPTLPPPTLTPTAPPPSPTLTSTFTPEPTSTAPTKPTPIPPAKATHTPQVTETLPVLPLQHFRPQSAIVASDCQVLEGFISCQDPLLLIQFDYTVDWGQMIAGFSPSFERGYLYEYIFVEPDTGEQNPIIAGGRSQDFSEGRGAFYTDFLGFSNYSAEQYCSQSRYEVCRPIQPGVVIELDFPTAQDICEPGPSTITRPIGMVKIDLPDNPFINGFVFLINLVSDEIGRQLDEILSLESEDWEAQCSPENRQRYDDKINEILGGVLTGSADEETNQNYNDLVHLANSIVFQEGKSLGYQFADLTVDIGTCPGAPEQRVQVGETARVCTKNERVIVRAEPLRKGREIARLEPGETFLIIDGPVCADSWSWWRIRTEPGLVGWVAEGGDSVDPYFICP